ncbi:MAG: SPOR domain-containing protein [Rubrivivax sp.]|jgi:DedD protein|nr:SPOR domain-containing protein [Rubrivivax sp.]
MRLPFFRPKDEAAETGPARKRPRSAAPAVPPDDAAIAAARTQARRRLVGALVLLALGVIGFPLLFETQPRPLPQDTPIVVSADALRAAPAATTPAPARPLPVTPALPADAGVEPVAPASAPVVAAATPAPVSAPPTVTKPPVAVAASPKPAASAPRPPPAAATPATGRWVVQVGAYNDAERLKAARAKLQKLGYASYTQDVDSATGRRTRVRVGPFNTRAEADAVAARVKTVGLQTAVLSL